MNTQTQLHKKVKKVITPKTIRENRIQGIRIYLLVSTISFLILAYFAKRVTYFPLDLTITRTIQKINMPFFAKFMQFISSIGFPPQSYIIVAFIIILLVVAGLYWEGIISLINAIGISLLSLVIKTIVHRPRPGEDLVHVIFRIKDFSFPSGHVMFYISFFGFLLFLTYVLLKKSLLRSVLMAIFTGLIVFIAPSRIYMGQHWASDTVGAAIIGSIWLIFMIFLYDFGKKRIAVKQPVAS